jgi:hypothetical protein
MPKGDLKPVSFFVKDQQGNIADVELEEIYFTVKIAYASKGFLFQKKLSAGDIEKNENGSYQFDILQEDTDPLKVGRYVFDIEIIGDRLKQTTIGNLILTDEVTTIENEV